MGRTADSSIEQAPEILKRFLIAPTDHTASADFIAISLRLTMASLGYLRRRGYRLPGDNRGTPAELRDSAYDILGSFLRCDGTRPYHTVFDYFDSLDISDYPNCDAEVLYDRYRALLLNFVRQELFRLRAQEDPGAARIKKRITRILAADEYLHNVAEDGHKVVCMRGSSSPDNTNRESIPYDALLRLTYETYLASNNMEAFVGQLFKQLAAQGQYRPWVKLHEFWAAAVTVICRHAEIELPAISSLPSPTQLLIQSEVERERRAALGAIEKEVVAQFIEKGKVAQVEASRLLFAAESYLTDLSNGGEADLMPRYFKEVMPAEAIERYLSDYKYVFETILRRAAEEFRSRVKNNPIIRRCGLYL